MSSQLSAVCADKCERTGGGPGNVHGTRTGHAQFLTPPSHLRAARPGSRRPLKTQKPKRAAKLKVSVAAKSSTFTVLKIAHLRPATLQFAVEAAKASGTVKVTTQVGGERASLLACGCSSI
jgi:hypothetical protein